MIEFDFLTPEQAAPVLEAAGDGYYGDITVFYAHEDGVLHGYFMLLRNERYTYCQDCPGNCVTGNGLWFEPEYRGRGDFRKLYEYAKETMEFTRIYSSGHGGTNGVQYLLQNGVRVRPGFEPTPLSIDERLSQLKVTQVIMDEIRSVTGLI